MKKVREGYKMAELGEIPNEWSIMKLSEIAEINPRKEVLDDKDTISFIAMEDITNNGRIINKTDKLYEEVKKGYTPFKDNDVLLAKITPCFENGKRALVGKLSNGIGFGSTEFHVLRANKESISKFLYYVISSHRFMSKAENNMTGSAGQKRVPTEFIKDYVLAVPTIEEQEKIALILSTVDEQIDNINSLIEKNKELKKGLMQNLLTKGIGHTKFRKTEIGEIPEEWKVITLGNISRNKGEYGIGASASEFIEGKPRYLRITDIGDGCSLLFNDIKGLNDSEYEKYLLSIGDVVFARTGNTTGKAYVYQDKHGELVYAGFLIKFSINLDKCMPNFIKYVIQTKRYWDWVQIMSTRSGQPGINSNEYSGFLVQIPSIGEQEKIASILSEVDEKIEKYIDKKKKMEELKRGLMQKLLTGEIRGI